MEGQPNHFGDVLVSYMHQRGIKSDTLSSRTEKIFGDLEGVAKTNIVRWAKRGVARGPRDWTPIIKIAVALSLNKSEANSLLKSAGYPPISKLASLASNIKVKEYLEKWDELVSRGVMTKIVTSLHQLPAPKRDFTGRAVELARLTKELQKRAIVGIFGPGGIGKTTLAIELTSSLISEYPDAQLFIKLKGTNPASLSASDAMKWVIRSFNSETEIPENEDELKGLYYSTLHNQRVLIVLDDVVDAEQVGQLIPPNGCALIVTSRQWFSIPGMYPLALDRMTPAEARDLFLKIAPDFQEDADEITKLCGYFPLAIRLAGSAVSLPGHVTREEFLKQLRVNLLEVIDSSLHFTDEEKGVETSLRLSYELINPKIQRLWCKLTVFPDSFDRSAAAAVWGKGTDDVQLLLHTLILYSMVDWNSDSGRYRLHDLMRVFAEKNLSSSSSKTCRQRHAAFYKDVLRDANDLYENSGEARHGLTLFDLEWENIRYGWAWVATTAEKNNIAAELCSDYLIFGTRILRLRLSPKARLEWLDVGIKSARQWRNKHAEGKHLAEKGIAHYTLGELQIAISCYEEAIEIFRIVGDRRGEGNSLGNLGLAYADKGVFRRAIKFYKQHLSISRKLGDTTGESNALANLGNAYKNISELSRALELHNQALKLAQELDDPHGEGASFNDIGNVYFEMHDYEKASNHYEKAFSIAKEIGDRETEGDALGNLGLANYQLGNVYDAIKYYEQALVLDEELATQHGKSDTLNELGRAYADLGELDRGLKICEQALKIKQEIGDRRGEAYAKWHKAYCLHILGALAQAIELAEEAYEMLLGQGIDDSTTKEIHEYLAKWKGKRT